MWRAAAADLGVPVLLAVGWSDPADHHLHSLARHSVELLRELQDLVGLHFLRFAHVHVQNEGAEEELVASVGHRQDLHPGAGQARRQASPCW